nr:glycosyltransferase family 2 protein [Mammaliicoccus sp. Marseille-Q6498]
MKLTIFTPTYNRKATLERLYNSLLSQTNKQFEWLIVDDGSTDGTEDYIKNLETTSFEINYIKQSNSGKHVATNVGLYKASGEIFTCLDSDDWFYDDAVDFMINQFQNDETLNGFIALDTYQDGTVVGEKLPSLDKVNWVDLRYKHNVKGDKCYVFKTQLIKDMTFPQHGKSRHMPPSYQLFEYSRKYNFKLINKPLKFVEYLSDGLTNSIKKQYYVSSENYCEYRKFVHKQLPNFKEKIKNIMLYDISWLQTGLNNKHKFDGIFDRLFSIILLPPSTILYFYFKRRIQ